MSPTREVAGGGRISTLESPQGHRVVVVERSDPVVSADVMRRMHDAAAAVVWGTVVASGGGVFFRLSQAGFTGVNSFSLQATAYGLAILVGLGMSIFGKTYFLKGCERIGATGRVVVSMFFDVASIVLTACFLSFIAAGDRSTAAICALACLVAIVVSMLLTISFMLQAAALVKRTAAGSFLLTAKILVYFLIACWVCEAIGLVFFARNFGHEISIVAYFGELLGGFFATLTYIIGLGLLALPPRRERRAANG